MTLTPGIPFVIPSIPASVDIIATPASAPVPLVSSALRDPQAVPTSVPGVLRATSPPELGDADYHTHVQALGSFGASGTLRVVADTLEQGSDVGTIDHVKICAAAGLRPGAAFGHYTAARMTWKLGVTEAHQTITMPPFVDIGDPFIGGGGFDTAANIRSSADLTTKPGGGASTWEDVNALIEVGIEVDYAFSGGDVGGLIVGEVWIEVSTVNGSAPDLILRTAKLGPIRRTFELSS
jgi:hypothetical protein